MILRRLASIYGRRLVRDDVYGGKEAAFEERGIVEMLADAFTCATGIILFTGRCAQTFPAFDRLFLHLMALQQYRENAFWCADIAFYYQVDFLFMIPPLYIRGFLSLLLFSKYFISH